MEVDGAERGGRGGEGAKGRACVCVGGGGGGAWAEQHGRVVCRGVCIYWRWEGRHGWLGISGVMRARDA
jgi:hypothetical protein